MSTPDDPTSAPTTSPAEQQQIRNSNEDEADDADREDNEDDEDLEGGGTATTGPYGGGKAGGNKRREAIDLPPSPGQSLKGEPRTSSSKPGGGGGDNEGGEGQPKSKQSTNNDDAAGAGSRRKAPSKPTNTTTAADSESGASATKMPQKRKKPPTEQTISIKQEPVADAAAPSSAASAASSTGGGKSGSNITQSQKDRRLAMSRINAQRNRDRKRVIVGMMQEDKKRLMIANAKLKDENELLRVVIATLKQQWAAGATAAAASAVLGVNPVVQGIPLPTQNMYANAASLSRPAPGPADLLAQIGSLSQQQQQQSMGSNLSPAGLLSLLLSSPSSGSSNDAAALPMLLAMLGQSRQADSQGPPPSSSIPGSIPQLLSTVGGSLASPQPAPAVTGHATSSVHAAISEMASTPSGRETLLKLISGGGDAVSNQLQSVLSGGMPGAQQEQQQQNPGPQINSQFGWKTSSSSRNEGGRGLTVEQQLQLLNSISSKQSPPPSWGGVGIQQGRNPMPGGGRSFSSNPSNMLASIPAAALPPASGINLNQPQDSSQNALLQQLLGSMQQGNTTSTSNATVQGATASQQQPSIQSLLSSLGGGSASAFAGPVSAAATAAPQNLSALSSLLRNNNNRSMNAASEIRSPNFPRKNNRSQK
eukprot:CAMPEP_0113494658 /NCGR_PEP_ID=MMETSP0014_2-20120614/29216_1 /TAXON_ID=2857 /ORGANISM="Nitzschia sp." /LENGTH=648 /DNA_ID=CAMNT_0000388549 /DNA_START=249 /DNA_END=2195 /DNA_ORIENTATION=- /assembly_acc=CAM_ASM_000159